KSCRSSTISTSRRSARSGSNSSTTEVPGTVADHRRERVEHLLRSELASLLLREAKDPRLAAVSISAVRMTADLRQARVFFRIVGDTGDLTSVQRALERA